MKTTSVHPGNRDQLEDLLRASAATGSDSDTSSSIPTGDDPVARRVALYAELLRLAPPAREGSQGRLLVSDATTATEGGGVRAISLTATPLEIGRGSGCGLQLDDPETSRRHCRVAADDARGAWVEDLHSANGTWLNDQRLTTRAALRDGDIIRLGRTLLVFANP